MTVEEIFIGLRRRNVELNKPASMTELRLLESKLNITLHPFFFNLLSKFNGFVSCEYDHGSQLCIWGIDELISHSDMMIELDGDRKFVIGDFLVYSDFISCSLENDSTPTFLLEEKKQMSLTIHQFFDSLIKGAFDFL
jgi:hypothetical protein